MRDFFMFVLVGQWWERDQQQVQPVRPGKLQEAHSCPKQRDAFNLLCSCIRSQIHSWRDGVSGWTYNTWTTSLCMWGCRAAWTLWVSRFAQCVIHVLLWSGGGSTEHFLCSTERFPKVKGKINLHCTPIPWSQTEHSAGAAQVEAFIYQWVLREMSQSTAFSDSNIQTVETKVGTEGWG